MHLTIKTDRLRQVRVVGARLMQSALTPGNTFVRNTASGEGGALRTKCGCNNCLLPEIGLDVTSSMRQRARRGQLLFPIVQLITSGIRGPAVERSAEIN